MQRLGMAGAQDVLIESLRLEAPQAYFDLGTMLRDRDPAMAKLYLQRSFQLQPSGPNTRPLLYTLGRVLADLGDTNMEQLIYQRGAQQGVFPRPDQVFFFFFKAK